MYTDHIQDWIFRLYPDHIDLAEDAETAVARLGGSDRRLQGGKILRILSNFLSWKSIRNLQSLVSRFGWRHIQTWKAGRSGQAHV